MGHEQPAGIRGLADVELPLEQVLALLAALMVLVAGAYWWPWRGPVQPCARAPQRRTKRRRRVNQSGNAPSTSGKDRAPPKPKEYAIYVRVLEAGCGNEEKPVKGICVELYLEDKRKGSCTSDADGKCCYQGLENRQYKIKALDHQDYEPAEGESRACNAVEIPTSSEVDLMVWNRKHSRAPSKRAQTASTSQPSTSQPSTAVIFYADVDEPDEHAGVDEPDKPLDDAGRKNLKVMARWKDLLQTYEPDQSLEWHHDFNRALDAFLAHQVSRSPGPKVVCRCKQRSPILHVAKSTTPFDIRKNIKARMTSLDAQQGAQRFMAGHAHMTDQEFVNNTMQQFKANEHNAKASGSGGEDQLVRRYCKRLRKTENLLGGVCAFSMPGLEIGYWCTKCRCQIPGEIDAILLHGETLGLVEVKVGNPLNDSRFVPQVKRLEAMLRAHPSVWVLFFLLESKGTTSTPTSPDNLEAGIRKLFRGELNARVKVQFAARHD